MTTFLPAIARTTPFVTIEGEGAEITVTDHNGKEIEGVHTLIVDTKTGAVEIRCSSINAV